MDLRVNIPVALALTVRDLLKTADREQTQAFRAAGLLRSDPRPGARINYAAAVAQLEALLDGKDPRSVSPPPRGAVREVSPPNDPRSR